MWKKNNEGNESNSFRMVIGVMGVLLVSILCYSNAIAQIIRTDSIVYMSMEDAYKRTYTTSKVEGIKPTIDGQLDEDFWTRQGEWSEPFIQAKPYEAAVSEHKTQMKILYDDRYIYVGVICHDLDPKAINRFIGNRDDSQLGDLISIAFDPYHDYRVASQFTLNAGGNKSDMMITDDMDRNESWNAVWDGKTHVNIEDGYWTAEFRIPFTQLRYRQHTEDGIWGLHVERVVYRTDEEQNWSLIPRNRNGFVYSFGELHGMTDLPRSRGIEISPYVSGEYQSEPKIAGSPYQTGDRWVGNFGLDAKFAVSDYTLDVTINPDYGQVEQDPSVMNLTTQETFYEEKRPFFLEGNHIFSLGSGWRDNMFYSRRLGTMPSYSPDVDNETSFTQTEKNVPILGALKQTGTNQYGLTVGLMQSFTARASAKVTRNGEESKEVVEPFTNYTVARVQKNWEGNTLLGGMITSTNRILNEEHLEDLLVKDAFTAGIDFTQYFNNRLYYIDAKAMFSTLQGSAEAITRRQRNSVHFYQRESAQDYLGVDPNRTSLDGTGGYVEIGRKGNSRWNFSESFNWASPGFDLNDVGYLGRADELANETSVSYQDNTPWFIFRSNEFEFEQENAWNYGGDLIENVFQLSWEAMTKNRFEWSIREELVINKTDSRMLRGGPDMRLEPSLSTSVDFNTDRGKALYLNMGYGGEHSLNNDMSENALFAGFSYRIGNHVRLSGDFNYEWNRNDLQYVGVLRPDVTSSSSASTYIMGRMHQKTYGITLRAQVSITPDISIQFYGAPFTSIAKYDEFKAAADTKSSVYEERFRLLTDEENGRVRNPNFSFNEFRSNLVARWEYLPGSTLYFVWEHTMTNEDEAYRSGWGNNLDRMFGLPSVNTFMVKLNYRFTM
ncbi:carbohydrate binding family 9 domain-containing protein [Parabacteroides sp. OttesenSCG-928-G07]|nr:carbohydrate binding family 9 domain-containing protein [Parabacteroides sp. OttesenSCG-928-G07]